jgi:hypothetical protein
MHRPARILLVLWSKISADWQYQRRHHELKCEMAKSNRPLPKRTRLDAHLGCASAYLT